MKKLVVLCLGLLLLTGCAGMKTMYLEPTALSKETQNVLELLFWNGKFYDFKTDRRIAKAKFQCWSLTKDGEWKLIGIEDELMHERSEGSFVVSFGDDLKDGYRVVVTSRDLEETEASNWATLTRNLYAMPWLERKYYWTEGEDIVYNTAIPLIYQFDKIYCYEEFKGNLWEEPKEFLKMDYFDFTKEDWKAYCLTVTFEIE